jgi:aryl-alcohol dehydrogenase-like predicted oxidoreductase
MQNAIENRITLGKSELKISPLGVGTWAWGDSFTWGFGRTYNQEDVRQAFQTSMDAGAVLIDTAEVYGLGKSEKLIGQLLPNISGTPVLATKFFPFPWRFTEGRFRNALKNSLRRLGVEQVDLYQMHWPFKPNSVENWMDAMASVVKDGLVRFVGVSNYDLDQTRRAQDALAKHGLDLASNQIHYSLIKRDAETDQLIEYSHSQNISVIAYSPLAQGLLTGKYTPDHLPGGGVLRRNGAKEIEPIQPLLGLMREIGEAHSGKTIAQVALNWTICKGTIPIPGAKNRNQAADNCAALDWRLTADEIEALDQGSASFA